MGSLVTPMKYAGGKLVPGRIQNPSAMIVNPDHSSVTMRRKSQIAWVKRYAQQGDMVNASRVARKLGASVSDIVSGRVQNDGEPPRQDFVVSRLDLGEVGGTVANVALLGLGWFANGALAWALTPSADLRAKEYNWFGGQKKGSDGKYPKSTRSHVERLATMKLVNSTGAALIQTLVAVQIPRWLDPAATIGIDTGSGNSVARAMIKYRTPYLAGVYGQLTHAFFDKFLSRDPSKTFQAFLRNVGSLGPTFRATKGADGKWTLAKDADGRYIPDWDGFSTGYLGKKLQLDAMGNAELIQAQQQQQGAPPAPPKVGDAFSENREVWDPTVTVPPPVYIPAPLSVGCGHSQSCDPAQEFAQLPAGKSTSQVVQQQTRKLVTLG